MSIHEKGFSIKLDATCQSERENPIRRASLALQQRGLGLGGRHSCGAAFDVGGRCSCGAAFDPRAKAAAQEHGPPRSRARAAAREHGSARPWVCNSLTLAGLTYPFCMDDVKRRKRPVHWLPEPGHPSPIVFLTCCTKNRRPCLNQNRVHEAIREAWQKAAHWQVGRYVVMPDHVHLFCAPMSSARSLQHWTGFWRSLVTRTLGEGRGTLWQSGFWDTQLRGQDSYAGKWEYVRMNPVRAGLVDKPDDWPFQGEMSPLDWLGD